MSKEIKVGVIGCGAIGRQHIARLMNTIPETRVVAVADYYQPSAQAVAEQNGITCCATGGRRSCSANLRAARRRMSM